MVKKTNIITSKTLPFHIDGKYHLKRSDLLAEIQALVAPIGTSQTLAAAGLFVAAKKATNCKSKKRTSTKKSTTKKSTTKKTSTKKTSTKKSTRRS